MKHWTTVIMILISFWFPPHHPRCVEPPCPKGHLCIPAGERCHAQILKPPPIRR